MDDTGYDKTASRRHSLLNILATTSQLPQSKSEHPDPPLPSYFTLPVNKLALLTRWERWWGGNELAVGVMMTDDCKTSLLTNQ